MSEKKSSPRPEPPPLALPPGTWVLACKVFAPELEYLGVPPEQLSYLDQGLHRTPQRLRRELEKTLAELEREHSPRRIVLVYGYCGGGLEGISCRRAELVVPLAHDCIPVLLGGSCPTMGQGGIFYLSAGWIDHGRTPLTEYHRTAERWGEEDALWVAHQIMKGYDRVALIESPCTRDGHYLEHTREMADIYEMQVVRLPSDLGWIKRLLECKPGPGVAIIPPGQAIGLEMFQGAPSAAAL